MDGARSYTQRPVDDDYSADPPPLGDKMIGVVHCDGADAGDHPPVLTRCDSTGNNGDPMLGAHQGKSTIVGIRRYSAVTTPDQDVVTPSNPTADGIERTGENVIKQIS